MSVFIDSCVLIAYANPRDTCHTDAKRIVDEILDLKYGKPFLSDYVFSEVVTVMLQKTKDLMSASEYGQDILRSELEMLKVDENAFKEAWQTFQGRGKTGLSFTDCTNLALMKTHSIKTIASFDQAFKKRKDIDVID